MQSPEITIEEVQNATGSEAAKAIFTSWLEAKLLLSYGQSSNSLVIIVDESVALTMDLVTGKIAAAPSIRKILLETDVPVNPDLLALARQLCHFIAAE